MADGISVEIIGARELAADLSSVSSRMRPDIASVVKKGATNIKNDLVTQMRSSTHFKGVAPGISYDMVDDFEAEIGPTKGSPGSLANIAYFGSSRAGGGTVEAPEAALEREASAFESHLADIAERRVFG